MAVIGVVVFGSILVWARTRRVITKLWPKCQVKVEVKVTVGLETV